VVLVAGDVSNRVLAADSSGDARPDGMQIFQS
jgi:hypothetical protein